MALVYTIFYLDEDLAVFQVIINVVSGLLYSSYLVNFRPYESESTHFSELFTEICQLCFGYNMMIFTHFVPDAETRF